MLYCIIRMKPSISTVSDQDLVIDQSSSLHSLNVADQSSLFTCVAAAVTDEIHVVCGIGY